MLKKSLIPLVAISVGSFAPTAEAQSMSADQRAKLSKQLETLINKSKATLTSRQATAYRAYKGALGSSSAALELYLDCIEKVNFIEAGKKTSDFRDWKRAQKDHHSDPGFRLALQHQLNWLVLTIEAARNEDADYSAQSATALSAISNIFDDAKKLEGQNGVLRQDVLGSVFAKAYGFGSYKIKDWPTTPLNIAQVFDKIVFPPLRDGKKADRLHSAWMQRISYEEQMLEYWAPKPKSKSVGMKKNLKPPAYYKFIETQRPNLVWEMEMDTFKAGDEYGAASRMIKQLSRNISHNNAPKWAKELNELIAGDDEIENLAEKLGQEQEETAAPAQDNADDNDGYIKLSVD